MDGVEVPGPEQILEQLSPLLGISGAFKNESVPNLIERLKDAPSFMCKCMYIEVIRATKNQITLGSFMESGGWVVLNTWLVDAKKTSNVPLMIELLQVMKKLPVTVELLKLGSAGKVVKQLSKSESSEELKRLAADIFEDWKALIKKSAPSNPVKPKGEKRSNSTKHVPEEPVEKRARPEKLFKLGSKDSLYSSNKPKVQESTGFMNALQSSASQPRRPLSKKQSVKNSSPTQLRSPVTLLGKTESPTSELQDKQTTSMETNNAKSEDSTVLGAESPPPDAEVGGSIEQKQKPKKRKSVTWAPDESLRKIHTFDLDETERANVHRQSFMDALQSERLRDRQVLQSVKMLTSEDVMDESTKWSTPKSLDCVLQLISLGRDSKEVTAQAEREQQVLAFLFLSRESLPESPFEPDPELESHPPSQPKVIPLYEPGDEPAAAAFNMPPAALLETPSPRPSSSKAVQSLLSSMMNSGSQTAGGDAGQETQPPQQVFAKALDPAIQSQISTENLKQILQSTQGPRPVYPSGPNVPLLPNHHVPAPGVRPMAPMPGQIRYDAPPRPYPPQQYRRHDQPFDRPYGGDIRGYGPPQPSQPPFRYGPPQSSPPGHYGPPQLSPPPVQYGHPQPLVPPDRYPPPQRPYGHAHNYGQNHGPNYGQNRTDMRESSWRR